MNKFYVRFRNDIFSFYSILIQFLSPSFFRDHKNITRALHSSREIAHSISQIASLTSRKKKQRDNKKEARRATTWATKGRHDIDKFTPGRSILLFEFNKIEKKAERERKKEKKIEKTANRWWNFYYTAREK